MKGKRSLSDAEVLSIILGAGANQNHLIDIARTILQSVDNNLTEVCKLNIPDLLKINGIGDAKAAAVIAAFELGRRMNEIEATSKKRISNSRDSFEIFKPIMGNSTYEEFWILLLNRANRVIRKCCIGEGGLSGVVVDPKKIFKIALDHHASSIILGHNHPSGIANPSEADNKVTQKVKNAGLMLDIAVLDHVIIGDTDYYSYADNGAL